MNGLLGLNVRTLGVSRDQIMSAARPLGGAWMLIQDDPELVTQAKAAGFKTIYRQSGDETLSLDPATFVQTRAEKGADFVHLTNELDPTPEQLDWTRKAIDYATPRGIKLVIHNYSTGRSLLQWRDAATVCRLAVLQGHAIGLHVYRHSATNAVDKWLNLKHELGGLWLVTEYAFLVDPYHGWRGVLSPAQYGAFFDATLPLFEREQMPLLLFSGDPWPTNNEGKASGFGVLDNGDVLKEIQRVNQVYIWSGIPVNPTTPIPTEGGIPSTLTQIPSAYVNVRSDPVNGADLGDLIVGDVCTVYPPTGGWVYQTVVQSKPRSGDLQAAHDGWISLQGGSVKFTSLPPILPNPPITLSQQQYADLVSATTTISRVLQEVKPPSASGGF